MKVLSWQFLLFDVEGIGAECARMCVCVCAGGSTGSWQFVKGVWVEVEQPVEWVWLWAEGWTDRRGRMERRGSGLVAEVWNSYFVIWNMSEISNEIWSITASHTSQWSAQSVWVCVCVFSGNVLSFLFWSTGALDGGRGRKRGEEGRERGRRGGFSTWTYWSFTVLSEVFFFCFHLSGRCQGELSVLHCVYIHSVCVCVCVCVRVRRPFEIPTVFLCGLPSLSSPQTSIVSSVSSAFLCFVPICSQ